MFQRELKRLMMSMPDGGVFELNPHPGHEWGVQLQYRLQRLVVVEFVPVEDWHSDARVLAAVASARAALCVRAAVHVARLPG